MSPLPVQPTVARRVASATVLALAIAVMALMSPTPALAHAFAASPLTTPTSSD
jgi:hypothetical protein